MHSVSHFIGSFALQTIRSCQHASGCVALTKCITVESASALSKSSIGRPRLRHRFITIKPYIMRIVTDPSQNWNASNDVRACASISGNVTVDDDKLQRPYLSQHLRRDTFSCRRKKIFVVDQYRRCVSNNSSVFTRLNVHRAILCSVLGISTIIHPLNVSGREINKRKPS